VRLVTYNVNSLPARLERVLTLLEEHRPDVVCLQETKTTIENFPHLPIRAAGYVVADLNGRGREGVAILAAEESGVDEVVSGLPGEPRPDEPRWIEATVGGVRVVSVYVPNGRAVGTTPFEQKLVFLERMAERATALGAASVIAGDMNVCPTDLDVWDTEAIHGSTHVTDEERSRLGSVLEAGFTDAFRTLHPDEPGFSWWDYRAGHFHKGFGLRIDLALLGTATAGRLGAATILRDYRKPTKVPGTKPSDHAPLLVEC